MIIMKGKKKIINFRSSCLNWWIVFNCHKKQTKHEIW